MSHGESIRGPRRSARRPSASHAAVRLQQIEEARNARKARGGAAPCQWSGSATGRSLCLSKSQCQGLRQQQRAVVMSDRAVMKQPLIRRAGGEVPPRGKVIVKQQKPLGLATRPSNLNPILCPAMAAHHAARQCCHCATAESLLVRNHSDDAGPAWRPALPSVLSCRRPQSPN